MSDRFDIDKITAVFEFTRTGYLKAVMLNAPDEQAQDALERALNRLFKPDHFGWVRRLFKR